jgi:hypothetical protein
MKTRVFMKLAIGSPPNFRPIKSRGPIKQTSHLRPIYLKLNKLEAKQGGTANQSCKRAGKGGKGREKTSFVATDGRIRRTDVAKFRSFVGSWPPASPPAQSSHGYGHGVHFACFPRCRRFVDRPSPTAPARHSAFPLLLTSSW